MTSSDHGSIVSPIGITEPILTGETISRPRVAIIIPCHNEGVSIGKVITDFQAALPDANVYVYDNNSTDDTISIARACGATVRREPRQGKGNVVRRAFADVEADVYVLVDGDDTYDASAAPVLVGLLINDQLDMV